MKIKVYRGTKEIGGTCIEVTTDNGRKLWVDLGSPLCSNNPDTAYAHNGTDALLISHPHQDHYGLMEVIDRTTPVFIGQVTRDLINATKLFLKKPLLNGKLHILEPWKWSRVADAFRVYPYLVDHSSPEAFAFLVEADGKRLFYSGDFRSTGRKGILFDRLIANPPSNIDCLMMEGTMINRVNSNYPTEKDVEEAIRQIVCRQRNVTFVVSSAQNIDRFVSVMRACLKSNKQVVVDVYNAWVLEVVRRKARGIPAIDSPALRIYNLPSQLDRLRGEEFADFRARVKRNAIGNDLLKNPAKYVSFLRCPNPRLVNALRCHGKMNVVYSQWEGYLKDEHKTCYTDRLNALRQDKDVEFFCIHTSGHATMHELQELAATLKPRIIVPVHTNHPQNYLDQFAKKGFINVSLWDDNREYSI